MLKSPQKDKISFDSKYINHSRNSRIYGLKLIIKRIIDVLVATSLLIVLFIPMSIVAILIRLDSSGSILFTQSRIGLDNKPFKIFKFRTMVNNASAMQTSFESKNEFKGGVLFKIKDDPRITKVGKFLRRYSIDEIPQLINVIKGDMSLVGPRPLTVRDSLKLSSEQNLRHSVLPGITGLWQVKARSESDSKQLHIYDSFYVKNWSLKLDFIILLNTILVVISGKGAY